MKKKAQIHDSKISKIFFPSLGDKRKEILQNEKKESKTNSFLSLNFFQNENSHNLKNGIVTNEMTIISNGKIDLNNFSFSFLSFNEYIPEEGNEEEVINNFNVDNYSINVISRK